MTVRLAAIDLGNDHTKAYIGSLNEEDTYYMPNVIALASENRSIVELEKTPEDGLHVQIISSSLKLGKVICVVGNLATKFKNKDEVEEFSIKSSSDQPVILLLTVLALDAAKKDITNKDIIEIDYALSTGLPLKESKLGKRKEFKEKIFNGTHEVKFLDTPQLKGKIVKIKIVDGIVNIEGRSAMVDLTMDVNGNITDQELTRKTILVHDIGGGSTDSAIIEAGGSVDNQNSDGIDEGAIKYLDNIIARVESATGYKIRSRKELVDIITSKEPEEKNHVWFAGQRQSIKSIVEEELTTFAREEYKLIKKLWSAVPSLRLAYCIGGGSIIIKEYLERANEVGMNYPLRFVNEHDSVWMIARAYWKILHAFLKNKESVEVQVASAKEGKK